MDVHARCHNPEVVTGGRGLPPAWQFMHDSYQQPRPPGGGLGGWYSKAPGRGNRSSRAGLHNGPYKRRYNGPYGPNNSTSYQHDSGRKASRNNGGGGAKEAAARHNAPIEVGPGVSKRASSAEKRIQAASGGAACGGDKRFFVPYTPQTYGDLAAIFEKAGLDATGTNMGAVEAISSVSDGDWGEEHEGCGLRMLPGMELDAPQDLAGAMARLKQQNCMIADLKESNEELCNRLQHAEENCNLLESELIKLRQKLRDAGVPVSCSGPTPEEGGGEADSAEHGDGNEVMAEVVQTQPCGVSPAAAEAPAAAGTTGGAAAVTADSAAIAVAAGQQSSQSQAGSPEAPTAS